MLIFLARSISSSEQSQRMNSGRTPASREATLPKRGPPTGWFAICCSTSRNRPNGVSVTPGCVRSSCIRLNASRRRRPDRSTRSIGSKNTSRKNGPA
jgi:hypothetical protein